MSVQALLTVLLAYQGSPCTLENAVARERSAWAALARIRKAEQ